MLRRQDPIRRPVDQGVVRCPVLEADVDTERCWSCPRLDASGGDAGRLWLECRRPSGLAAVLEGFAVPFGH